MQEKRLGRGLRSLLALKDSVEEGDISVLPVEGLRPSRVQPRANVTEESLRSLGESVR